MISPGVRNAEKLENENEYEYDFEKKKKRGEKKGIERRCDSNNPCWGEASSGKGSTLGN